MERPGLLGGMAVALVFSMLFASFGLFPAVVPLGFAIATFVLLMFEE